MNAYDLQRCCQRYVIAVLGKSLTSKFAPMIQCELLGVIEIQRPTTATTIWLSLEHDYGILEICNTI